MAYDRQVVATVVGDRARVHFPPDLLVAGHTYCVRVGCIQGGFPAAATATSRRSVPDLRRPRSTAASSPSNEDLPLTLVLALVASRTARADNKDKADTLFKQGKKLMGEKKYAEACEAFEQAMKLDPGIGTQLNIAQVLQGVGQARPRAPRVPGRREDGEGRR